MVCAKRVITGIGFVGLILMPLLSIFNPFELAEINRLSVRGIDFLFSILVVFAAINVAVAASLPKKAVISVLAILSLLSLTLVCQALIGNYYVRFPEFVRFLQGMVWISFACIFIRRPEQSKALLYTFFLAASIIGVFSVWLYITIPGLHRIAGWFSFAGGEGWETQPSYNEIGAIHALAAVLSTHLLFSMSNTKRGEQIFLFFVIIVNIVGLILTGSRSAMVAFTFVVVLVFWLPLKKMYFSLRTEKRYVFTIIVLGVVGGILGIIFSGLFNRYADTLLSGSHAFSTAMVRVEYWQMGLGTWLESPWSLFWGHGYGSITVKAGITSAHSFFLNILVSLGIFGLFIVLSMMLIPTISTWKSKDKKYICFMVLSIALIVSLTGNVLVDPFYGGITYLLSYSFAKAAPYDRLSRSV